MTIVLIEPAYVIMHRHEHASLGRIHVGRAHVHIFDDAPAFCATVRVAANSPDRTASVKAGSQLYKATKLLSMP